MSPHSTAVDVYRQCVDAIQARQLIRRESKKDKEFPFQNWFRLQLEQTQFHFEQAGRNAYPDFSIVEVADGYEVKSLAYPGRDVDFDCNSQPPSGYHNGRTVYYVFGRYPKEADGDTYPVLDLTICHGDFLNADHDYLHKNRSVKGFGSYGDIMIRDRKMYVAPTPFRLLSGVAHQQTLILPSNQVVLEEFKPVGTLRRVETQNLIVGYHFDLRSNNLVPETVRNPSAGQEHFFRAWRLRDGSDEPVLMRAPIQLEDEQDEDRDDEG